MAAKKKVAKKKTAKKRSKKKTAKKKLSPDLDLPEVPKQVDESDIVYTNGTGKPDNGRPPRSARLSQIKALASIGCTQQEMAAIMGMNKDTFTIMKKNNPIIKETIESGRAEGKGSLRRKQHEVAMRGDTNMLKWLGKNRLGQSERILQHTETSAGESLKNALMGESETEDDEEDLSGLD